MDPDQKHTQTLEWLWGCLGRKICSLRYPEYDLEDEENMPLGEGQIMEKTRNRPSKVQGSGQASLKAGSINRMNNGQGDCSALVGSKKMPWNKWRGWGRI